ncbi:capsular polysaccharide synthesis protein [Acinetobacter sp. ANC5681]|uniref:capsular polysaccharide synthesis protein n=1 Tax=Acinetobacter sp. ANC5681 TaxID=2929504 RepID=UPI00201A2981|nr:capsular polysaccharide synthesis protein [Acinetobacter sp. ANC5681]MCL5768866.1 capsular polysaccharide synthesis protein [Acinetobacter sp. ANC5681]
MQIQNNQNSTKLDSNNLSNLFSYETDFVRLIYKLHKKPWRILYFGFIPKKLRKKYNLIADRSKQASVADAWEKMIYLYQDNKIEHFQLKPKKTFLDQKIIWQYWAQGVNHGQLPEIVNLCFTSVDKYCADYKIIRLDDSNINDYLDLPDFVYLKKQNPEFKHAFFADLIRLALLDVYGGTWLDATIMLTSPIKENIANSDFFMFQRSSEAKNKRYWSEYNSDYFGWDSNHRINVLNSFIVGKKGNIVIHTCLDLLLNFWKTQNNIPHYFFFQILFDVLINKYFSDQQSIIVDDTLPHLLQSKANNFYDQTEFNKILSLINIHKMTYIANSPQNSFYNYLKDNI